MAYRPIKEKVTRIHVNEFGEEKTYTKFPFITGGEKANDPESEIVQSLNRKASPFTIVHTGDDRTASSERINSMYIVKIETDMVDVPTDIVGKYTAPDDESEEDKEKREKEIQNYFEIR